jgi:hypothetical protein
MITAAAVALGAGLGLAVASGAGASTLKCTSTESCGGADLAFTGHGPLSLAVLNPDSTINGGFGYNNEKVGFTTSGASNGTQDFTVFQDSSEPVPGQGGVYGHGNYVAMYTPGGLEADTETGQIQYCVSVMDTYPTVNGKVVQRWSLVLRNCNATGRSEFTSGSHEGDSEARVSDPNLYQLWAPTEVPGPYLEFQDVALNSSHYRHGFGGGNFVMDDRGFGGSGTWGLAYPENDQLNQKFTIIGCTKPVTVFNTAYYNCPS